jgi:hypothetical protein
MRRTAMLGIAMLVSTMLLDAPAFMAQAQSNPVPFINQPLMPASVAPGGSAFTLTVNGDGFVTGAVVNWNGAPLRTTFVSSRQVTAAVPASNIAKAGAVAITVSQAGAAVSNFIDFEIAKSVPRVAAVEVQYSIGQGNSYSYSVATADFNGDGRLDVVTLDVFYQDFAVLLANKGGFQKAVKYPIPNGATNLVTGDFNNDGKQDVAVAGTGAIDVFPGNGDGTFGSATTYSSPSDGGTLAAADFNGDGVLDVAADTGQSTVMVLVNGVAAQYSIPGQSAQAIAVGDFNGDGKLDLAVSTVTPDDVGALAILLGNGDGTFQPAITSTTIYFLGSIAVGDFNRDGKLDLAVEIDGLSQDQEYVAIYLGQGDGTFRSPVNYFVGQNPEQVVTGDFNNDGVLDLAMAQFADSAVAVLLGKGDGTFTAPAELQTPQQYPPLSALATGDFTNDGTLDIVATGGSDLATVFMQGRGAVASLSPYYVNFPLTVVGTESTSVPVTLTNTGFANLSVVNIATGANFLQTNSCPSGLAPLASCTLDVTFKPQAAGLISQTLSVADNALGSPQTSSLSGQGRFLSISPGSLNFGAVKVGTTSPPQTLTISNVGNKSLTLTFVGWRSVPLYAALWRCDPSARDLHRERQFCSHADGPCHWPTWSRERRKRCQRHAGGHRDQLNPR